MPIWVALLGVIVLGSVGLWTVRHPNGGYRAVGGIGSGLSTVGETSTSPRTERGIVPREAPFGLVSAQGESRRLPNLNASHGFLP